MKNTNVRAIGTSVPHRPRRGQAANRRGGFCVEPLEPRTLLAFAPAGPEFRVNTTTSGSQSAPSVAADAGGDFVIVWDSFGQDGPYWDGDVYARRYDATGIPQGAEFRVNTFTAGVQHGSAVACDADGDFVVAWQSEDGSSSGVYAQRYNAAGAPQGGEFRVNTFTAGNQFYPAVACDADGDFVVTWASESQDGSRYGVYAQRYSAAGAPQGREFRVNTVTTGEQNFPSVACDAGGDFVVAWESWNQDGSVRGVHAQRFNAAGVAQGAEFRVNGFTTGFQSNPSVACDADGDFVVAWDSVLQQDSRLGDINAQRYDAAGVPQGEEFRVNSVTTQDPTASFVACDRDGNFVVTWGSWQEGFGYSVSARRYNAAGVPDGGEFRVNTFTTYDPVEPSVASDADGNVVFAWDSYRQGGSGFGIHAQRYTVHAPAITQVFVNGPGLTGQTTANGTAFRTLGGIDSTYGYPVPAGANQAKTIPWNGSIDRIALRFTQDVASELQQGDLVVRGVNTGTYTVSNFAYDAATKTGVWTLSAPIANDKIRLFLDDALVGGLDGEWQNSTAGEAYPSGDGTAGGAFDFRFNVLRGDSTQDGVVNALDLSFIKARLNKSATSPGATGAAYSPFADLNADGIVNALDLAVAKQRLNGRLPTGEPATAVLFSSRGVTR